MIRRDPLELEQYCFRCGCRALRARALHPSGAEVFDIAVCTRTARCRQRLDSLATKDLASVPTNAAVSFVSLRALNAGTAQQMQLDRPSITCVVAEQLDAGVPPLPNITVAVLHVAPINPETAVDTFPSCVLWELHHHATDAHIDALCRAGRKVRMLDVSDSVVSDEGLRRAAEQFADSLESLSVRGMRQISNSAIVAVASKCLRLRRLDVSFSSEKITDPAIFAVAQHCQQLLTLDVGGTTVTDNSICEVARRCPLLRELDVSATNGRISDRSVAEIARRCPELEVLNVSSTQGTVTDVSIEAVAQSCIGLRSLSVTFTSGAITDASIDKVVANRKLQALFVCHTEGKVTDTSIMTLPRCPELLSLDVGFTGGKITDKSMIEVARHCRRLRTLSVCGTMGAITNATIRELSNHASELEALYFARTGRQITAETVLDVAKQCRRLEVLQVGPLMADPDFLASLATRRPTCIAVA